MADIKWLESNRIQIVPPKKTKKVTGTRFATILGLNPWSTEFEMWCAITKTYEKPFEDTIYTIAGKTIEPKQASYMEKSYGMDIIRPSDVWGENYFSKTFGDFFPESKHFGGMWDYLLKSEDGGHIEAVLEMKTTKRAEDWKNDIPEYYALQAALYAWLYGVDDVIMVASFLGESDYTHPEHYVPNAGNTIARSFKVSERYPDFVEKVKTVEKWWEDHINTGISPAYDEKKDADILKALRTKSVDTSHSDIADIIVEAEKLETELDEVNRLYKEKSDRLDVLKKAIKEYAQSQFKDGDKSVELHGTTYQYTLSRSESKPKIVYDDEAMKTDGVFDKYASSVAGEATYRLNTKLIKN